MFSVTPLAGPEFGYYIPDSKPLRPYKGGHQLHKVLSSRPWSSLVSKYLFALLDLPDSRQFYNSYLQKWFRSTEVAYLSSPLSGAPLSSLAPSANCFTSDAAVIFDLADIDYTLPSAFSIKETFAAHPEVGCVVPCFNSSSPKYSYLKFSNDGAFVSAAEKCPVSDIATLGTYIFRDFATFLGATSLAVRHSALHNNLTYFSLLLNYLPAMGLIPRHIVCSNVRDLDFR